MLGVDDCRFISGPRGGDGSGREPAVGLTKGEEVAGRWAGLDTCGGILDGGTDERDRGEAVVPRLFELDVFLRI